MAGLATLPPYACESDAIEEVILATERERGDAHGLLTDFAMIEAAVTAGHPAVTLHCATAPTVAPR
jgi:hypothetical protein